jgi:predicted phosphoribosyltransferase
MFRAFEDRADAGRRLAEKLRGYAHRSDAIVLGLARGGVPVASEVARALDLPLDVFIVRKLGVPGHEELAMGAIATGGVRVLDGEIIRTLRIPDSSVAKVTSDEHRELERREDAYRSMRPTPDVEGKTVILVDDGLATGASMFAAVTALRKSNPAAIVVAVPVAAPESCAAMHRIADDCDCVIAPRHFGGVGSWYGDFSQTTDAEVRSHLEEAARRCGTAVRRRDSAPVRIPLASPPC